MLTDLNQVVWPTDFSCTLVTDTLILPNLYNITISVEPIGQQSDSIGIGFRKIRHFVDNYLNNSVVISTDNPLLSSFEVLDNTIVHLPTEPYDFYVGALLYTKFLKISKKYFHINHFTIDSIVGDRVQYSILDPEEAGLDLEGDHWWNTDSVNTGSGDNTTWEELNIKDGPRFEPRIIKGGLSEQ
jgi:hypothetical protein